MSCSGNLIWVISGGLFNALTWLGFGLFWCIIIVGIPIGLQCFKMADLQLAPFGKEIVTKNDSGSNLLLNILRLIFGGLEMCIANLISAFFLCITITGVPFAKQSLKLAKLSLVPFGEKVI